MQVKLDLLRNYGRCVHCILLNLKKDYSVRFVPETHKYLLKNTSTKIIVSLVQVPHSAIFSFIEISHLFSFIYRYFFEN